MKIRLPDMNEEQMRIAAQSIATVIELAVESNPSVSADDLKALAVKLAVAFKAGIESLNEGS